MALLRSSGEWMSADNSKQSLITTSYLMTGEAEPTNETSFRAYLKLRQWIRLFGEI
jgi:hypothetical protein